MTLLFPDRYVHLKTSTTPTPTIKEFIHGVRLYILGNFVAYIKLIMSLTAAVSLFFLSSLVMGYVDVPCEWKSLTGATYGKSQRNIKTPELIG